MIAAADSPALRHLTVCALSIATIAMLALSMLTNATFGYRFGTTALTAGVFAAANVVADIWKGLGLIVIAALLRQKHRSVAALLAMLWLVALSFGVASSMGVYVQDRTAMVGGREALQASLRDIERELSELEAIRSRVGDAGVASELESAIDAVFAKPVSSGERVRGTVGTISSRCTRVDVRTADECHRVAELRTQLAIAVEKNKRGDRIADLHRQARVLRERGAADAADPVAELFSWMSRGLLSVRDVGFGFPVAFALLIELVSAFGPIGVATYAAATRLHGDTVATPASQTAMASPMPMGRRLEHRSAAAVVDYVAEETVPASETSALGGEELYESYRRWCGEQGRNPLPADGFTAEFDRLRELPALRGKVRKFGTRYFGIALARESQMSSQGA